MAAKIVNKVYCTSGSYVSLWVEDLAKRGYLEDLIKKQTKGIPDTKLKDLAQDMYLDLLRKPEDKVRQLVRDRLVENFCNRMIKLQLRSCTSGYYKSYRDFSFRNQREPGENELSCPDDFS